MESMILRIMKELKTPVSEPATNSTTSITKSLLERLSTFKYDPESGLTFDLWYKRYENVLTTDGAALDDSSKVRLIVQKLDQEAFRKYDAHLLPRSYSELTLTETVTALKELFGHRGSQFARRYQYLQTRCEETSADTFDDYTGLVNQRHELSDMSSVTADQMKCLVWICGLHGSQFNDVRELALEYLEQHPTCTLKQLHQHVKNFTRLQSASKAIEGASSSSVGVHKVTSEKTPRSCRGCGKPHFRDACPHRNENCRSCGKKGHIEAVCFQKKKQSSGKKSDAKDGSRGRKGKARVNSIEIHGFESTGANKIFKDVHINNHVVRMRMDRGADVTIISASD